DSRLSETLSFVHSGLKDICVSRLASRSKGWGINVPDDLDQTIWVWFDALSNYINAVGYSEDQEKFKKWWQESEVIHVVGKGVSRFHAVYWPAMLLSAGLKLPDKLFVHGYITIEGDKMSKSLGKTVDPVEMAQKYGSDVLRYYLLREIPAYEDGDFSEARLRERYNTDLANGLGNLLARVLALAESHEFSLKENDLEKEIQQTEEKYNQCMSVFRFNEALNEIWRLISKADEYISLEKPWEKKDESEKIIKNLSSLIWVLGKVAYMLNPFMPKTSDLVLRSLQLINQPIEKWSGLKLSLKKEGILFPRI
ncbi:MAG: methionine--tRNA ligase, partial [Candidatus Parcubacteria bacterium]|nr:methionine--tRNA ligase [Candidatus Parcubacteria bacterium]